MVINCVWEHNGNDTLLYAEAFPGAYTRGKELAEATRKMEEEIRSYCRWAGKEPDDRLDISIVQEKVSSLAVRDADSDVIFESERRPLAMDEYLELKRLALKSARDFQRMFDNVPDKERSALPERNTFYGPLPRTALEMYHHTKNVYDYYFGEIRIEADHEGTILECRQRGFAELENKQDFLQIPVCVGSYGEEWSVRKVLRRFIWHDRIHAKAMQRMCIRTFGMDFTRNPFKF